MERPESNALEKFLAFLADDIFARPDAVKPLSPELAARFAALTADVSVSLSDAIEGVVTL
jgi:prlF antitoxin for toxin YhaV_toxin